VVAASLTKEDYLVWKDLVVTGYLAFLFLLLTKNEQNSLRGVSIYEPFSS